MNKWIYIKCQIKSKLNGRKSKVPNIAHTKCKYNTFTVFPCIQCVKLTGETAQENSPLKIWAASEWSTFLGVPGLSLDGNLQQT